MMAMTTMDVVTLVTASIGAVLGVMNTWDQLSKNKVRLKVIPKITFMTGAGSISGERPNDMVDRFIKSGAPWRLSVEVINMSFFPVNISEFGFGRIGMKRFALISPELSGGRNWPLRLESREAVTAFATIGVPVDLSVVTEPLGFAVTDCNTVTYGRSPLFTEFHRALITESRKQ